MKKCAEFLKSLNKITFVKLLEYCMIINGIWKSINKRKLNWSQILINFMPVTYSLFACLYAAVLNSNKNLESFSEAFMFVFGFLFIMICWIILITNEKQLNKIFDNVEAHFYVYDTTNLGLTKSKALKKADKHIIVLFTLFFCFTAITVTVVFATALLFSKNRKLVYPVWMPFDTENNLHYLVFSYELIILIHGILLTTTVCILYVGLSTFYYTILNIIGQNVKSIDKLIETEMWHSKKYKKSKVVQTTMEHIIRNAIKQHVIACR